MYTVSAAEANRQFSTLLRQASQGETVTVLSHGRPVAVIGPVPEGRPGQAEAKNRLLARLRGQTATGERNWTRDELYERGA